MTKTSVKFPKNLHKTVGGVAHTRYQLLFEGGRTEKKRNDGMPNTMSLRFSTKRRGTINRCKPGP